MRIGWLIAVMRGGLAVGCCLLIGIAVGCASGEIDEEPVSLNNQTEEDTGLDADPNQAPGDTNGETQEDAADGGEHDEDTDVIDGPEPCSGDEECAGDERVCDRYDEVCTQACSGNMDCDGGVCDTFTGHCLECDDDGDCTDGVCDDEVDPPICRACMRNLDCPGDLVCSDDHECVECLDHSVCPGPFTPFCDMEANTCVRCAQDDQCPDEDICFAENNECVECIDDTDCPPQYECDEQTRRCTGCEDHTDCPGQYCRDSDSVCVDCFDNQHCTGGFLCDIEETICRPCLKNDDCEFGEVCVSEYDLEALRIVHFCADCETDLHCVDEEAPHCSSNYECVE